MDKPPKKRRFWQLHLSTAVLLMLLTGGFLWVNCLIRKRHGDGYMLCGRGWPFIWQPYLFTPDDLEMMSYYESGFYWRLPLFYNLAALVGIDFSFIFVAEFLIRRREGRKP